MELPNVEELADRAVNALLGAMVGDAWDSTRASFGRFFGKGRSTPEQEETKLEKQRATLQACDAGEEPRRRDEFEEAWRARILDLLEFREGAVKELSALLEGLPASTVSNSPSITATATGSSVVQIAARDFTAGDQTFGLQSGRGRNRSQHP